MSDFVFFGDTDCDLTYNDITTYNINLIYMPIYIEGEEYNIDLKNNGEFKDFYQDLTNKKMPTTAAINAQNYIDAWEPFLKNGKDIVYVAFSSNLSATFDQMKIAIKELEQKYKNRKIYYVDTLSISSGGRRITVEAAKMAKEGATPQDIVKFVEQKRTQTEVLFIVDDLNHLRRGGRISSTTAMFGSLLNMKPILTIKDGKLVKLTAEKGFKKSISYLAMQFKKMYVDDNMPIYLCHAQNEEAVNSLKEQIKAIVPNAKIEVCLIGPIVAAHCGLKAVGIIFSKK